MKNSVEGKKFNSWTVIKEEGVEKIKCGTEYRTALECQCDCGQIKNVIKNSVVNGYSKSCGCMQKKRARICNTTHGMSSTGEYSVWQDMLRRCYKKYRKDYDNYGGRGIQVCDRWRYSFINFINDMGYRPSEKHSIDRIDNDKHYCPENCRWVTQKEQTRNKRNNKLIEIDGVTKCLDDWLDHFNLNRSTYKERVSYQRLTPKEALLKPVNNRRNK